MPETAERGAEEPSAGLVRTQMQFAGHIRDPQHAPSPADVDDRRMAIYRDLFFNNVSSLLESSFPVLRKLLDDSHWKALVRDFLMRHRCQSPFFLEISQEFLDYLGNERAPDPRDPPFLLELAHYEWVELALAVSDDEADPSLADPNGDLLSGMPVISPLAWNLSYRFPVHRITPDHLPQEPDAQPTHLVVYRNRRDQIEFLEINAVTQRLLQLLKERQDQTGLELLQRIAEELQHPNPQQVIAAGAVLLQDLRARDVILGTRRDAAWSSSQG